MGLDMFIYGLKNTSPPDDYDNNYGEWKELCYWRKANQIHKWFSDRLIKGQNPWGYYEITESELQGLLLLCKFLYKIKYNSDEDFAWVDTKFTRFVEANKIEGWKEAEYIANVLLPPDNTGCCFGSGDIDEKYWYDIEDTIKQLTKALESEYNSYFYMASW